MNLVVGATGSVGEQICRLLRRAGKPVRALCRSTADPAKRQALAGLGVELHDGDLKDPVSLGRACEGITTVISTASSTLSRQAGDSIESVDLRGHLHLVEAIRRSAVSHMVFVSFAKQALDFPLQTAKRAVENELLSSGRTYTILQPTYFTEVWLGPALGFDAGRGNVRILGSGEAKLNWISLQNVAEAAAACVDNPRAHNKVFGLGGPEALSQLEVLRLFESLGAPKPKVEFVPEADLAGQFSTAQDPLGRSFAALMLTVARGQVVDGRAAVEALQLKLTDVKSYARAILSGVEG
jgi:uncharacterized protein YbjT (DUF2867 family)